MTGVLVLAGGGSSRMGRPKQLLPYERKPLLRHAAETAVATGLGPVLIVLGAEAAKCREALGEIDVRTVINPDWEQGMGTSIRTGVAELERLCPQIDGVLVLLHDQPAIPPARLVALVDSRRETDFIVASEYEGITGVPAWFSRELFAELRELDGPRGAQKLIKAHAARLLRFEMPEAQFDLDTPEDYARVCGKDTSSSSR